jgi:transposase-like protein
MSRRRKRDAVLRPLRGEDLETVSRPLGVTAATPSGWRDAFLAAGEASLATRPAGGEELESGRLEARLGEMPLREELLEAKIAALEGDGVDGPLLAPPCHGGAVGDHPGGAIRHAGCHHRP